MIIKDRTVISVLRYPVVPTLKEQTAHKKTWQTYTDTEMLILSRKIPGNKAAETWDQLMQKPQVTLIWEPRPYFPSTHRTQCLCVPPQISQQELLLSSQVLSCALYASKIHFYLWKVHLPNSGSMFFIINCNWWIATRVVHIASWQKASSMSRM